MAVDDGSGGGDGGGGDDGTGGGKTVSFDGVGCILIGALRQMMLHVCPEVVAH